MNAAYSLYVYAFLVTFLVSLCAVYAARSMARRLNVVAIPRNERLHSVPIPLLGGVGIVAAFFIVIFGHYGIIRSCETVVQFIQSYQLQAFHDGIMRSLVPIGIILLGGLLIFLLGLVDDVKALGPKRKCLFEIGVGWMLYHYGIQITLFGEHSVLNAVATIFWVLAITNSFNLLDNCDGLAAGIACISSLLLLIVCIQGGQILVSLLLVIFMGAVAGFLRFNYPPASIFMGDAGSLFIGYMMSVLSIMSTFNPGGTMNIVPLAAPLLILAIPMYDTLSVIGIRIKNKKPIFTGDKNHFSHRLLRIGMTTRQTVSFIYMIALCVGMAAITMKKAEVVGQWILLIQSCGLMSIIYLLERIQKPKG